MWREKIDPPRFEGGSLVPVATYLLTLAVLSGLLFVSPPGSPPPLLGIGWGVFLSVLAVGALVVEGVSPRSLLEPSRPFLLAVTPVVGFWTAYNLLAFGLALVGIPGLELGGSRVTAHPVLYLAAFGSSLLFTAIPEELMFRGYLQSKFVSVAGGSTRRRIVIGVTAATALFTVFHLPRVFASGHGLGPGLATTLTGLALAGFAYGLAFLLTRNVWLVALFHATMNQPPFLLTVQFPPELHLLVGAVEYGGIVAVAFVTSRVTRSDGSIGVASHRLSSADD
ncbi:type II CAAX prenyl endopeptidase Rce1 family protein (plasmid) [Haloarcula salina]|uniref:CPBP family glutamic-type intramembrane protease n=1 Tax=Haloarcula salina TaxID=1429914 RepID=UPI003C700488